MPKTSKQPTELQNLIYDLKIGTLSNDNILTFYPHITKNQKNNFLDYFKQKSIKYNTDQNNSISFTKDSIKQINLHDFALSYLTKQYQDWEKNFNKTFPNIKKHVVNTEYGPLGCVFHTNIQQKRAAEDAKTDIMSQSGLSNQAIFRFKPHTNIIGKYTSLVTNNSLTSQNILIKENDLETTSEIKSNTFWEIIKSFLKALIKIMSLGLVTVSDSHTKYKNSAVNTSQLVLDPSYLMLDPINFHKSYVEQYNKLENTGIGSAERKKDLHNIAKNANIPVPNKIFPNMVYKELGVSTSNIANILNATSQTIKNIETKLDLNLQHIVTLLKNENVKIKFSDSETIVDGKQEMLDSNPRSFCSGATMHRKNNIVIAGYQDPVFLSSVLLHEIGHILSHSISANTNLDTLGNKAQGQLIAYVKKHSLNIDTYAMTATGKAYQNPNYHKGKDWVSTLFGLLPALIANEQFCQDFKNSNELSHVKTFTDSMLNKISINKISTTSHER